MPGSMFSHLNLVRSRIRQSTLGAHGAESESAGCVCQGKHISTPEVIKLLIPGEAPRG